MAYWGSLRGVLDPIPIRSFNGLYKPDDPGFNLDDSLMTELTNFCPDAFPALTTKPGYTVAGSAVGPVLGMGAWKEKELHVVFADGTWRRLNNDGTWTTLASGLSTSAEWSFCNFQGNLGGINLIGSNGVDTIKRYDGSTVQDLANAPAASNYIEQHDNRVYCASGNIIKYSALRKADDWATVNDAGEIVVESPDGELVTAVRAGPKHLIVFKPNSMYDLLGTGPRDYTLVPIAADIGAVNNDCTVNIGGLVYFLHTTGLYTYASARPNKDFCKPVMPYIRRINLAVLDKCALGTDGLNLFASLPLDTATTPNILLQYNLERGTWYAWGDYTAVDFQSLPGKLYVGGADGAVRLVGGTTNAGAAITSTLITKPFTAGSMARKQQWFKLWLVASVPSGSSVSVYLSGQESGEDWELAKTITAEADLQFKMILVPTGQIKNVNAVRIKLVCTGPVTIHEITRQLREMPMR
ncbi:hypothetical protein [Cohnella sp. GbtcB17]|uniref:hypothetical protein n=1 Tax=Cohnella sp. GbtcB17 TaxID=2824762 RepID=UPI001C30F1EE|nr:hypothetical protein [Cohnella sp. GbtcB17]